MVSHITKKIEKLIYFLLNDISGKFDAIALKRCIDTFFILSENIIINLTKLLPSYINYYDDIIEQEVKLANITKKSSILHIGCGSIPASSILITKKTQANILGIDRNTNAIQNAKKCIKKLGLTDYIKLRKKEALEIDIKQYNVIFIAQGLIQKEKFLLRLSKNITTDQLIILRSFSQNETLNKQDQFLDNYFTIVQLLPHAKHGSTISILLKKK